MTVTKKRDANTTQSTTETVGTCNLMFKHGPCTGELTRTTTVYSKPAIGYEQRPNETKQVGDPVCNTCGVVRKFVGEKERL